jgi:hypothetical protein
MSSTSDLVYLEQTYEESLDANGARISYAVAPKIIIDAGANE